MATGLPIVRGRVTWPGNIHDDLDEGGCDLPPDSSLFDSGTDFVSSNVDCPADVQIKK